jgi:hypothetical protein
MAARQFLTMNRDALARGIACFAQSCCHAHPHNPQLA